MTTDTTSLYQQYVEIKNKLITSSKNYIREQLDEKFYGENLSIDLNSDETLLIVSQKEPKKLDNGKSKYYGPLVSVDFICDDETFVSNVRHALLEVEVKVK